jgi:hypothetical protein
MVVKLEGADLYPWQQEVYFSYVNDDYKTYVLNTSRQIGKSLLISQLVLDSSINNGKVVVGVVSLTYKQTKLIYNNISDILQNTPILKSDNKSELEIKLVNGSSIKFLSIQNSDNIRGFTFDYLFCDEAAYYPPGVYDKVLLPTTLARGRKVVLASTPRGTNYFYDMFMRGIDPDDKTTAAFKFDYTANPNFDPKEINAIRKQLPDAVFRAEFLGEFSDNGSVFNNLRDVCILNDWKAPGTNVYCGIDVGLFHDYTVATIMDTNGNVVDIYRAKTGSINKLNTELETFLKRWKPTKTLVELNNQGVSVYEHLQPRLRGVEGFKTTAVSKPDLINQLQNSIEDKRIKLPSRELMPEIYNELVNYSFTYSEKSKAIIYGGLPGHHDDCVISLALVNKVYTEAHHKIKPKVRVMFG